MRLELALVAAFSLRELSAVNSHADMPHARVVLMTV